MVPSHDHLAESNVAQILWNLRTHEHYDKAHVNNIHSAMKAMLETHLSTNPKAVQRHTIFIAIAKSCPLKRRIEITLRNACFHLEVVDKPHSTPFVEYNVGDAARAILNPQYDAYKQLSSYLYDVAMLALRLALD